MQSISFSEIRLLPQSMGLYRVFCRDELLYVGLSVSLRGRLGKHHRALDFANHKADRISFELFTDYAALCDAEFLAITTENPKLNVAKYRTTVRRLGYKYRQARKPSPFQGTFGTATYNLLWEYCEAAPYVGKALKQLSLETGLSVPWLRAFMSGAIPGAGVNKVEQLWTYLTGKKLDV